MYIYAHIWAHIRKLLHELLAVPVAQDVLDLISGGRLCTLIGVPCRISMLSTFSTFANIMF